MTTRNITARFKEIDGDPIVGALVQITLIGLGNGVDGFVAPALVERLTDENGECEFPLWQNEGAYSQTHYIIKSWHPGTRSPIHKGEQFRVGDEDADISDLIDLPHDIVYLPAPKMPPAHIGLVPGRFYTAPYDELAWSEYDRSAYSFIPFFLPFEKTVDKIGAVITHGVADDFKGVAFAIYSNIEGKLGQALSQISSVGFNNLAAGTQQIISITPSLPVEGGGPVTLPEGNYWLAFNQTAINPGALHIATQIRAGGDPQLGHVAEFVTGDDIAMHATYPTGAGPFGGIPLVINDYPNYLPAQEVYDLVDGVPVNPRLATSQPHVFIKFL